MLSEEAKKECAKLKGEYAALDLRSREWLRRHTPPNSELRKMVDGDGCYVTFDEILEEVYEPTWSAAPTVEAAIEELTKDPLHQPVQFYRTWDGKRAVSIGRSRWEAESFLAALQAAKETNRG